MLIFWKRAIRLKEQQMPRAIPSVTTVLNLAYAEAKRQAEKPQPDSPQLRAAIGDLWERVKCELPVDEARVKRLDQLIRTITGNTAVEGM
ncbi:MAG: hypothetical protein ACOYLV_16480 [Rubrivivax sp.]